MVENPKLKTCLLGTASMQHVIYALRVSIHTYIEHRLQHCRVKPLVQAIVQAFWLMIKWQEMKKVQNANGTESTEGKRSEYQAYRRCTRHTGYRGQIPDESHYLSCQKRHTLNLH